MENHHFDRDVFSHQWVVVSDFVRHAAYSTAIRKRLTGRKALSSFWPQTRNAHFKAAVHDWCKVFGADGLNPTHWRKTAKTDADQAQKEFRKRIFSKTGFNEEDWKTFWKQMTDFRNTYAAHVELGARPIAPKLNTAIKIAFAYDEWVRKLISPHVLHEEMLERMYSNWLSDGLRIVMSADGIEGLNI